MNNKKKKSLPSSSKKSKLRFPRLGDIKTKTVGAEDRPRYIVAGKKASSYEWNVAKALDSLGLEYAFQVDVLGGRSLPGGFVLDYVVYTAPLHTPVYVNGDYWHRDPQRDYMQQLTLSQYAGTLNPSVTFWGADCDTQEAALQSVKGAFG